MSLLKVEDSDAIGDAIRIVESEELVVVDTGPLVTAISKRRFNLFHTARLGKVTIIPERSSPGFAVMTPERKHFVSSRDPHCSCTIEQPASHQAVVVVTGKHCAMPGGTGSLLRFRAKITFSAGQSQIRVDYQLTNDEPDGDVVVRGIGYAFRATLGQVSAGRVWADGGEFPLTEKGHEIVYQTPSAGPHPNWLAWHGPHGGLAIILQHIARDAPQALRVRPTGFSIGYYPEANDLESPIPYLRLAPGESKEHSTLFYFLTPDATREETAEAARRFDNA